MTEQTSRLVSLSTLLDSTTWCSRLSLTAVTSPRRLGSSSFFAKRANLSSAACPAVLSAVVETSCPSVDSDVAFTGGCLPTGTRSVTAVATAQQSASASSEASEVDLLAHGNYATTRPAHCGSLIADGGESVTLHTESKIQRGSEIKWTSEDKTILVTGKSGDDKETKFIDERFKDRLKMNHHTGDLTITDIRHRDAGLYTLQQINSDGKISYRIFSVWIKERIVTVMLGGSVTLKIDVTGIQTDDVIQWRFGDEETLIAEMTVGTKPSYDSTDERFRNRLMLVQETGDLTITHITQRDDGLYTLQQINSDGKISCRIFRVCVRVIKEERIKSVMSGGFVTLKTDVTEIQTDDVIQWRFGDEETLIAEMTVGTEPSYDSNDERFRNRLKMNQETGDLTITNITSELYGVYKAQIISSRGTEYRKYRVVISMITYKGESVTLKTESEIQRDSEIKWISEDKTILVTGKNGDDKETKYKHVWRFRDRLKMNHETGDLTIRDIKQTDDGLYTLQQINSDGKISCRIFRVCVRERIITVMLGGFVTLKTDVTEIQTDDVIQWRFGDEETLIAEMTVGTKSSYDSTDERFRNRLKLDQETGDLTITDITTELSGVYRAKIISNSRGTEYRTYRVNISDEHFLHLDEPNLIWFPDRFEFPPHCDFQNLFLDNDDETDTDYETVTDYETELNKQRSAAHRRENEDRITSVELGGFVTLDTGIQRVDVIQWRFGDEETLIAEMTGDTEPSYDSTDERFRNRLKMNPWTGDLTIRDITSELSGVYRAKIISSRGTEYRTYRVVISVITDGGESVTLKTESKIQRDSKIKWISEDETILVTGKNRDHNETKFIDERFKDRLNMNHLTGDLTITDIRHRDAGLYTLQQINSDGKISCRIFSVCVRERIKPVMLGGFVTLKTDVTEIQTDDVIQWRFGDEETLIAEMTVGTKPSYDSTDERFTDRLTMNPKTGDLTITNITSELSGVYKAQIISSRGTTYRTYRVVVSERIKSVELGGFVTLNTAASGIQTDDVIQWRFGDEETLIAEMTRGTEPSYDSTDERLKMNPWTGDLTITNITSELTGVYRAQIISRRGTEYRTYRIVISVITDRGESVTLNTESEIQRDSEIKWISEDKTFLVTGKNGDDRETKYTDDVIFRDRLKMNHQTGDLTITHITQRDDGLYTLQQINSDGKISCRIFSVWVKENVRSVMLGDSVALETDVTEIQTDDVIQWRFGDEETVIAEMTGDTEPSYDSTDERFRNRLKLDQETGDLTITNITSELSGVYRAKIISSRGTEYRTFRVNISEERIKTVMLGGFVTLKTDVTEIQTDDVIQWRFGDEETLIAEMNGGTKHSFYSTDERFTDRLKMKPKTGDLTITNITSELSGVYRVQIRSRGRETIYKVVISVITYTGESVTLNTESEIQRDSEIKWISEDETILVTGKNGDDRETKYTDHIRFKDRLKMNSETGDLTITDIIQTNDGLYTLQQINGDGKISCKIFSVWVYGRRPYQIKPNSEERIKSVKSEGSVTLKTDVTEIQRGDVIQWRFGDEETLIAEMTGRTEPSYDSTDERFSDRLMLDQETGDLTITNITSELSGVYKAKIISSSRDTEYRTYRVVIRVIAYKRESVTLKTESEIQRDSEIKWISEDENILVTGKNGDDKETKYKDNKRYKDRLKMNHHTGDLTITDIRQTDMGLYKLQLINSHGKTSYRIFSVWVYDCRPLNQMKLDSGGILDRCEFLPHPDSPGIEENESTIVLMPLLNEAEDRF
ncbi:uncharacterized protein LOC130429861 [Triplophysa dalaica]|uniref:uncharacterized protein LOC130429861 n=1 Tax=Triplophysa dalaica TaxID=1582913 RepID=UPI0024DF6A33|nr:uncharacterized protein LOC130429861 [Triplophysa dalaica]